MTEKEQDADLGEQYAQSVKVNGVKAAEHLFRSQWKYSEPEWYDHRLHLLDPEHHWTDFWTMSADNVIRVLPLGGRLLDLCSGDGFYAYYWWRLRAHVTCIERDLEAYQFAIKHHSHPRISYENADILNPNIQPTSAFFDVVSIRGAIEHFSDTDQWRVFKLAHNALKPGGYFCGDTVAANPAQEKLLNAHECEWKDEAEMRVALRSVFHETNIETWTLESDTGLHSDTKGGTPGRRLSLFWRCRKPL